MFDRYYCVNSSKDNSRSINKIINILNNYDVELSQIKYKLKLINDFTKSYIKYNSSKLQNFVLNPDSYQISMYTQNLELAMALKSGQENSLNFVKFYSPDPLIDLTRISIYLISFLSILCGSVTISLNSLITRRVILSFSILDLLKVNRYYLKILHMRALIIVALYPILIMLTSLLLSDLYMGSSFFSIYGHTHSIILYKLFWVFGSIEICAVIIPLFCIVNSMILNLINKNLRNFLFSLFLFCLIIFIILFFIFLFFYVFFYSIYM